MPWECKSVEESRMEFIKAVQRKVKSKSQLCREYGISRPTGDKWIKRYMENGDVSNLSSAPHSQPLKTRAETEQKILEFRRAYPALGAKKIKKILENQGEKMPSKSTVNNILKRSGCITKEASQEATAYKRFEREKPNEMWQADFKGHFAMEDNTRCHPLNVIDDCTRFNLCIKAQTNETYPDTKHSFEKVFREYGLPKTLLCDNGNPWGTSQTTGYTNFEVWLMKQGVLTIHGRIKHPQTQGKEERFNQTLTKELLKMKTFKNQQQAQEEFDTYREFYNHIRPHEAINMEVPADRYKASRKKYTEKIKEWEYTGQCELRRIKNKGYLTYGGQGYFLSEALGTETVAIYPSEVEDCVDVIFRNFRVARIDLNEKFIISKRCYLLKDDPRFSNFNT